jgi:hypothetical protein
LTINKSVLQLVEAGTTRVACMLLATSAVIGGFATIGE